MVSAATGVAIKIVIPAKAGIHERIRLRIAALVFMDPETSSG
jgi:hypothetical protein